MVIAGIDTGRRCVVKSLA
ncbi:hypothetical protein, partial [Francisella tularensis]